MSQKSGVGQAVHKGKEKEERRKRGLHKAKEVKQVELPSEVDEARRLRVG